MSRLKDSIHPTLEEQAISQAKLESKGVVEAIEKLAALRAAVRELCDTVTCAYDTAESDDERDASDLEWVMEAIRQVMVTHGINKE